MAGSRRTRSTWAPEPFGGHAPSLQQSCFQAQHGLLSSVKCGLHLYVGLLGDSSAVGAPLILFFPICSPVTGTQNVCDFFQYANRCEIRFQFRKGLWEMKSGSTFCQNVQWKNNNVSQSSRFQILDMRQDGVSMEQMIFVRFSFFFFFIPACIKLCSQREIRIMPTNFKKTQN